MKKIKFAIVLLFMGTTIFAQTKSVTGRLTALRPYNEEYAVNVDNTVLVLMKKVYGDNTKTSIDINPEYKNILIKRKGSYELNPKYVNTVFKVSYYINGKGWKCIKTIEPVKE